MTVFKLVVAIFNTEAYLEFYGQCEFLCCLPPFLFSFLSLRQPSKRLHFSSSWGFPHQSSSHWHCESHRAPNRSGLILETRGKWRFSCLPDRALKVFSKDRRWRITLWYFRYSTQRGDTSKPRLTGPCRLEKRRQEWRNLWGRSEGHHYGCSFPFKCQRKPSQLS